MTDQGYRQLLRKPTGPAAAEGIVAKLRASGGRITAPRRVTIEVLLAGGNHRHLSAEDIVVEVRSHLPDVAESTIYRTLTALEELGIVTHVHLGHGPSTFHLADQTHRHLVCRLPDNHRSPRPRIRRARPAARPRIQLLHLQRALRPHR